MESCVLWRPIFWLNEFLLKQESNSGPPDQEATAQLTGAPYIVKVLHPLPHPFRVGLLKLLVADACACCFTLKEIISQTDKYLVSLSSKTYVFEDKLTKH